MHVSCHILCLSVDEFNALYGSFAYMIYRTEVEADLYMNVDHESLNRIASYIQTTKIDLVFMENNLYTAS